jgi:hypothetical protein
MASLLFRDPILIIVIKMPCLEMNHSKIGYSADEYGIIGSMVENFIVFFSLYTFE